jgi:prophage regulatory protein
METALNEARRPLDRFLRRPEVESVTGLGRSTIYDKMAAGEFPKPVPISGGVSGGAVGWLESEIAAWQEKRIAVRDRANMPTRHVVEAD